MRSNEVTFVYRNWRGDVRERTVIPLDIEFTTNPHHDGPQWFLNAWDGEKDARRSFAIEDILSPIRHADPVANTPRSVTDHASTSPGPINCRRRQIFQGKTYAKSCERCGLGPCPFFNEDGTTRERKQVS